MTEIALVPVRVSSVAVIVHAAVVTCWPDAISVPFVPLAAIVTELAGAQVPAAHVTLPVSGPVEVSENSSSTTRLTVFPTAMLAVAGVICNAVATAAPTVSVAVFVLGIPSRVCRYRRCSLFYTSCSAIRCILGTVDRRHGCIRRSPVRQGSNINGRSATAGQQVSSRRRKWCCQLHSHSCCRWHDYDGLKRLARRKLS
jgi:hypothetical protein